MEGGTTWMMRQERWRKLIKPESKNGIGGGMRQSKEKGGGPLVVALGRTIWHLTTDAHELNKLSFPFLCQFPQPPSTRVEPARSLFTSQMMERQTGDKKKSFY